ncbi:MAG: type I-U CRISPR-associated protein Cas7 [Bryobacterales bacterium]|nr:type I-U CRISPR-associated protein Cas7 [Bryobacterales bacterium]MBV9396417.1 type I-U CRISPR-associated protein Cas7 [Bryobacterales bacterium]
MSPKPEETKPMVQPLTYKCLREAVQGTAMAFRAVTDLDPAGGEGDKVFPPTYQGGVYARETRMIDGKPVDCVLLDSVQSQANRLELALLEWHRQSEKDRKPFPLVQIDFAESEAKDVGLFSALEAPHRIADAVFLASEIEIEGKKVAFRHPKDINKSSAGGRLIDEASSANATGLFGLCPTALIFGMWDSHGARGGLGEKFQRALVSEIFGVGATKDNRRPASRVDQLLVVAGESLPIKENADGTWSPVEKGAGNAKLANVGLGNVTPSLKVPPKSRKPGEDEYNHGGVTIEYARQITVLSLPALRRLRFPIKDSEADQEKANVEARTVLAALALSSVARQWASGFSLRSRCDLVPKGELVFALLKPGSEEPFTLAPKDAPRLLAEAVEAAKGCKLPWPTTEADAPWKSGCLTLKPANELAKAVALSRRLAAEDRD